MKNKRKENKKIVCIVLCIICMFVLSMILSYKGNWNYAILQPWSVLTVQDKDASSKNVNDMFQMNGTDTIQQNIRMVSDHITGISIYLDNSNLNTEGILKVKLIDKTQQQTIKEWDYSLSENHIDGFYNFYMDEAYQVERDNIYMIMFEIENLSGDAPFLMKKTNPSADICTVMQVGKIECDFAFSYRILQGDCNGLKVLFCFFTFVGIIMLLLFLVMVIKKKKIECLFVMSAFLIGIIYMFALPPFATPDEGSHYVTVYAESNILLGQEAYDEEGRVIADGKSALYLIREEKPTKNTYLRYIKGIFGKIDDVSNDQVVLRKTLSLKHPGYIPQVLGVSFAREMGMNGEQILLMGRLFALIWYCFVMYWAIKLIPYWKMMLFLIGILPMTMQQVVSYNYDSVLFGIVFFSFAYMMYLKYTKSYVEWKDYLLLVLCAGCIVTIKFIYLPIFAIAILIPKEKFGGGKKKTCAAILLLMTSGIAMLGTRLSVFEKAVSTGTVYYDSSLKHYTLQMCFSHPIDTIIIFYRTIQDEISRYLISMLTSPLGWVEIKVPEIVFFTFLILLLISVWGEQKIKKSSSNERWVYGFVSVIVFLLVLLAMLLDYTYIGSYIILGVQGRYFLPILPIMMLLVQNDKIVLYEKNENYLMLGAISAQLYTVLSITSTVVSR